MKFTLVRPECGDWEALYIDGKLVKEDQRLSAFQILKLVKKIFGCEFKSVRVKDEVAEAGMPELFSEIDSTNLME
jgi:hypothetical protein